MANNAQYRPNPYIVKYVFDNIWTVAQLEAYITSYQPGGVSLAVLRRALKHGRVDDAQYSRQCYGTGKWRLGINLSLSIFYTICR
jgi:hypothetical protein